MQATLLTLTLSWILLATPWSATAAPGPAPLLPPRVEKAIADRIAAGEYPAMVVAVVDGDRSEVRGFGKLANGKAPDADTVFQIGSITKTFTATLLADASLRGTLTLDTPVARLLPTFEIPAHGGKHITVGELASQVSGLPRMPGNLEPANPQDPYADYDAARLRAYVGSYQLTRDPGSKYEYSNLGFGLLDCALARHAGTSYADLVQARIFTPLGMTSTGTTFTLPLGPHWAMGHDPDGEPAQPWHLGVLAGAGAINSTGADMLRYLKANMGRGKGPLREAMRLAHQPRHPAGEDERVGLAWMTRHGERGDVVWHNGETGGYASFMGFTADGERGVVILTNTAQLVDDLGFATLLADTPLEPAVKPIAMSPAQLDAYVGAYQLAPGFILTVFRDGDQLNAKATGQGAFPIFPIASDRFFARVAAITIDFQRDDNGNVASLVLHQNGHDSPARRLGGDGATKAGKRRPAHLDSATLQQYVGRHQLAPGAMFDITLADGQLKAQLTGQPAFPVYPSARDEFYYTVVDAQLSFKRGTDGKVDALVLHQNGADHRAPRIDQ